MGRRNSDSERHHNKETQHLEKGASLSHGSQTHATGNEQKRRSCTVVQRKKMKTSKFIQKDDAKGLVKRMVETVYTVDSRRRNREVQKVGSMVQ